MKTSLNVLVVMGAFVAMLLVLQFYPVLEGLLEGIGTDVSTATGYTLRTTEADNARTELWAVFPALLIIGLLFELWRR